MLSFHCIHCGKKIQCNESHAGKSANCPSCEQPIQVPSPADVIELAPRIEPTVPQIHCTVCGALMPQMALICIKCGAENATLPKKRDRDEDRREEGSPVGIGWLIAAYLMSVLFPIGGFICGIVFLCKKEVGHGVANICLSMFSGLLWGLYSLASA